MPGPKLNEAPVAHAQGGKRGPGRASRQGHGQVHPHVGLEGPRGARPRSAATTSPRRPTSCASASATPPSPSARCCAPRSPTPVNNDDIAAEELYVSACYCDEGPTIKRWRPRARGRTGRIRKRTSHITVIVSRHARLSAGPGPQRSAKAAASRARRIRRGRAAPPSWPPATAVVAGAGVERDRRRRHRRRHRSDASRTLRGRRRVTAP